MISMRLKLSMVAVIVALLAVMFGPMVYSALVTPTVVHTQQPSQGQPIKSQFTLRSAAVLTNAYVDTDFVRLSGYTNILLAFDVTQGSLTSFEYKVWMSHDNVNWFVEATETVAATVITDSEAYYTISLSADVKYYKIIPMYGTYLKLQVKGTGTATGSSCAVYAMGVGGGV